MSARDVKLTEFNMLHLIISHVFCPAVSQTVFEVFKIPYPLSPSVHLSNLINHCQAPSFLKLPITSTL